MYTPLYVVKWKRLLVCVYTYMGGTAMARSHKPRAQGDKTLDVNVHLVYVHPIVCSKTQKPNLKYSYTRVGGTAMARSRKLRAQKDKTLHVNVHLVYVHHIVCI